MSPRTARTTGSVSGRSGRRAPSSIGAQLVTRWPSAVVTRRGRPKASTLSRCGCFVAVWPPAEVDEALEQVPRPVDRRVRWTTPDQWHVTLAFLGEVADQGVPDLSEALVAGAAAGTGPWWPDWGRPPPSSRPGSSACPSRASTGWPGGPASPLPRSLAEPSPSDGTFHGHLTLARARGRHRLDPGLVGTPVTAEWVVGQVSLVRSILDPRGARYDTVARAHWASRPPDPAPEGPGRPPHPTTEHLFVLDSGRGPTPDGVPCDTPLS